MSVSRHVLPLALATFTACAAQTDSPRQAVVAVGSESIEYVVRDTTIDATIEATGIAQPYAQATLATKMMGTVIAVLAREGDHVRTGDPLIRIDARDLDARREQVTAAIASAETVHREAELAATRMRALYADSAAPRAQLDAAEAALARAAAGVAAARASQSELGAIASYAVVRAPFDGVVTHRGVDPGAFAAPGAPLLTVQDQSRLRLTVTAPPAVVRGLRTGAAVAATIEGVTTRAVVEGIVPSDGSLYTVNAIVANPGGRFLSGGTAALQLKEGTRTAILIPTRAIVREGDLTGVHIKGAGGSLLRWVRLGKPLGAITEVTAGLDAGTIVLVPATPAVGG